jgi:DNA-binding NtrC family response regulator
MTTPILLIEDDLELARATTRWLRRIFPDAFVSHAKNADEAIMFVTTNPTTWQLVVSDYDLGPGGNGGDILRFIQAHAPHLTERFVYFSASLQIRKWHSWIEKPSTYEDFKHKALSAHGAATPTTKEP